MLANRASLSSLVTSNLESKSAVRTDAGERSGVQQQRHRGQPAAPFHCHSFRGAPLPAAPTAAVACAFDSSVASVESAMTAAAAYDTELSSGSETWEDWA